MIFTFVLPLIDNNDDDNFASWLSCPAKGRQSVADTTGSLPPFSLPLYSHDDDDEEED